MGVSGGVCTSDVRAPLKELCHGIYLKIEQPPCLGQKSQFTSALKTSILVHGVCTKSSFGIVYKHGYNSYERAGGKRTVKQPKNFYSFMLSIS